MVGLISPPFPIPPPYQIGARCSDTCPVISSGSDLAPGEAHKLQLDMDGNEPISICAQVALITDAYLGKGKSLIVELIAAFDPSGLKP